MAFTCGSIDEKGVINSWKLSGFNKSKSLSELIANSIDAGANQINFESINDKINIIDDGNGMLVENIHSMFSLYKSNHSNNFSMGKAGFGAKPALLKLSNGQNVKIITKNNKGEYFTINIPFHKILSEGKWNDNIICDTSNKTDIDLFNKYNIKTGTLIELIDYKNEIINELKLQFNVTKYDDISFKEYSMSDYSSIVFGKFKISMKLTIENEEYDLKLYNPLSQRVFNFKKQGIISIYEKDNDYYFQLSYNNNLYEIKIHQKSKKSFKKTLEKVDDDYSKKRKHNKIGVFYIKCYLPEALINKNSAEINYSEYDKKNLQKHLYSDIPQLKIYRNNQFIGLNKHKETNFATSRGNAELRFKSMCHVELCYNTFSTQDNQIDDILGIQSNKNQFNCLIKDYPNLERLIYGFRQMILKEYWEKINEDDDIVLEINDEQQLQNNIMKETKEELIEETEITEEKTEEITEEKTEELQINSNVELSGEESDDTQESSKKLSKIKKTITVPEHIKGKVELEDFKEKLDKLSNLPEEERKKILEHEDVIKAYNLILKHIKY